MLHNMSISCLYLLKAQKTVYIKWYTDSSKAKLTTKETSHKNV